MFEQLNDDCQMRIIRYLDLKDQLALWKANKNTSERLNANICQTWKHHHQKHYYFNSSVFADDVELDTFLSRICEELQSLNISDEVNSLKILNKYKFPNLRELEFKINSSYINDSQTQTLLELLVGLFPSLISLKLVNVNIGPFKIGEFKNLRKLDLWECHYYSDLSGSESLEELIIDMGVNENNFYVEVLDNFPKLRKLAVSHDNSDFEGVMHEILKLRCNDITEFCSYDCMFAYSLNTLQSLNNLTRLTLIGQIETEIEPEIGTIYRSFKCFTVDEIHAVVSKLPLLEHLDLVRSEIFLPEKHLWKIINACPSLKILNIDGMVLEENFFEESRRFMDQALKTRSVPLTIYCHDTGRNSHLVSNTTKTYVAHAHLNYFLQIEANFRHPKLEISFLPLPLKIDYSMYTYVEFRPLTTPWKID